MRADPTTKPVFIRALRGPSLLFAAVTLLAACGTSPPEQFFTLTSEAPPVTSAAQGASAFSITVGPITVPEIVDRPQFVLRSSPGRVEIDELARWAAPLKSEIPRVVADHLASALEGARVSTSAQRAAGVPDYRVLIDVQRFESMPAESATLQAQWEVRGRTGAPLGGRFIATEPAGAGYEHLTAAHSRAIAALSRDIAAAIAQLKAAPSAQLDAPR